MIDSTSQLISRPYLELQRHLHAQPRGYGGRGDKWAGVVEQISLEYGATSILDYGCGQGTLIAALRARALPGIRLAEYDPAIPGKDYLPEFADLVTVTDVLEHIEPDRLTAVLQHVRTLARKAVFVVVSTKTSNKVLRDGRNAHLIIQPAAWWASRFQEAGFRLQPSFRATAPLVPTKEWAAELLP